jgi:hypothetical protein
VEEAQAAAVVMRRGWIPLAGLALVGVALGACDKGDGAAGGPRDAVIAAWKQGGLEPSAFTPATVGFGADCQSGTVAGVDVVVCQYGAADEAKAAEEPALDWVGEATGVAQAAGRALIAAADRRKADPSGRTINQLVKLAPR